MRANAVYLSIAQLWTVAKFCIENKGVTLASDGSYTFRVNSTTLAKEFTEFSLTAHHIKKAMDFYVDVCKLTNNMPKIPAPEMDSELETGYKQALALLEKEKDGLIKTVADQNDIIANLLHNMQEIRKISSFNGKTEHIKKFTTSPKERVTYAFPRD